MDPKKLAAFAGGDKGGPPPGTKEGGKQPSDEADAALEEANKDEGGDKGQKFDGLVEVLNEFADDVEAACDELDPDSLQDPESDMSPEDQKILTEGLDSLDKKLKGAMQEAFKGGISMDDAHEIAGELDNEELLEDADRVAGWLFRVSQVIGKGGGKDDSSGQLPDDSSGKLPKGDDSSGQLPPDDGE